MEREETVSLTFPIYLSSIYSNHRKIQRVETILEFHSSLSSFFNSIVADVIGDLVQSGSIREYEEDQDEGDDAIVKRMFERNFRLLINDRDFGYRLLDDLGMNATELRNTMKLLAFNLVEDTLATAYEHICGEAEDQKKRLSRVLALSAVGEKYDGNGLPTSFVIETTITLDHFKRIN